MPHVTVADIRRTIQEMVSEVKGEENTKVYRPGTLDGARSGDLVFSKHHGRELADHIRSTKAAAIVCSEDPDPSNSNPSPAIIIVENPRLAFMRIVGRLFKPERPEGIHPSAVINDDAIVGVHVYIGPYVVIGRNCTVGDGTVVHSHVVLYENSRIGQNVTIDAHTIIGADGFGYERAPTGELVKFPHFGGVIVEDGAEIGPNCCIDRGTLGDTIVGERVRLDDTVHVGHNTTLGPDTGVGGGTIFSGGVTIGARAWIAPGVTINTKMQIGDEALVGLGAVVVKNVEPKEVVAGNPARKISEMKQILKHFRTVIETANNE